jgi:AbrB family looped-hinge helix DNA binding protein
MDQVTVSPKYQVVIPQSIREMLGVKPGQKMRVIAYDNKVIFMPVRPIQESRGTLKGINTDIEREDEERL